jgi:hypothetical protein
MCVTGTVCSKQYITDQYWFAPAGRIIIRRFAELSFNSLVDAVAATAAAQRL